MVPTTELTDQAVRAFVTAVNAHDRSALKASMTSNATMTDDGTERPLSDWLTREVFDTNARMDVASQSEDGRDLVVDYTNGQWGQTRTRWHFKVQDHRVAHFDTGQA
jgi:hypothetical protein